MSDGGESFRVLNATSMPVGTSRCIALPDRRIALFRTEKGFFAVDDQCPHRGGSLSEGDVIDGEVVCPWHFWPFDLETGRHGPSGGRFAVASYATRLEGEDLMIEISREGER